jgi:hypothetical protein
VFHLQAGAPSARTCVPEQQFPPCACDGGNLCTD